MLNQISADTYREIYNSLPMVEEQYEKFKHDDNIDLLFKEISQLSIPHEVLSDFGLFLNHRHWNINDNQLMIEATFDEEGSKGFKTKAVADINSNEFLPVRWKIIKNSDNTFFFVPLEFSNDIGSIRLHSIFQSHFDFFYLIAQLIFKFELQTLFGFAIVSRNHIKPITEKEVYLETSEDNVSIVKLASKKSNEYNNSIPTTWGFDHIVTAGCKSFCRLNTSCSSEWSCWNEGGTHVKGQIHTPHNSHSKEHAPS